MHPHRSRLRTLVVAAVSGALVASSCGSDDDDRAGSDDTVVTETAGSAATTGPALTDAESGVAGIPAHDPTATIRAADVAGVRALDPHKLIQRGDRQFMQNLYDPLLIQTRFEDGTIGTGPWLATSFTLSDDGMSWEFELRDDVVFQDGTPFNAEAVKANIERAKTLPDSTVASVLETVETVEVIDNNHVVFHLSAPDPSIPYKMATESVGLMISPAAFDTDLEASPVGSGPFKLVSAEAGGDVVFEAWDDYWNEAHPPLAERVIISTIPDGNARLNGIRSGDLHIGYAFPPQDAEALSLEEEGYHFIRSAQLGPNGLEMNAALPPFDDVRVRRAVGMAIDRQALADAIGQTGLYTPLYQVFPPGTPGYVEELDVDTYDPDAARALIQEAGAEGADVTLLQLQLAPWDTMGLVAQQALSDIGLDVELIPVAAGDWASRWDLGQAHGRMAVISGGGEDPSTVVELGYLSRDNPTDPPAELVEMADAAKALSGSAQQQAYEEINRWLLDNPVHVPMLGQRIPHLAVPEFIGAEQWSLRQFDFRGIGLAP